jgi:hypothetical protein
MSHQTGAGLAGLRRVPDNGLTAIRTRRARQCAHAPPPQDQWTKWLCPRLSRTGREARTTRNVHLPRERPQQRIPSPPEVLNRAPHTCELGLPVTFPYPHHRASTSLIRLQESCLHFSLLGPYSLRCRRLPDRALPSQQQRMSELPSAKRFTARVAAPSFAVRGTSKALRFRPRTARLPPSSQDARRFSL